jgi:hypothetical protein
MNSPQPDNKNQSHSQQKSSPSGDTSQQLHFVQAKKIVATWPEWKRNVCFAATSSNDNSTNPSDKK